MRPELSRFVPSFLRRGSRVRQEGNMYIMPPDKVDHAQVLNFLGPKWQQREGHLGQRFVRDMRPDGLPEVGIEFGPHSFSFFVNNRDLFRLNLTKITEVRLLPNDDRFPARIAVRGQDSFLLLYRDSLSIEFNDVYSGMSGFFTFEQLASAEDKDFHIAVAS